MSMEEVDQEMEWTLSPNQGFTILPDALLEDTKLSMTDVVLLAKVVRLSAQEGACRASNLHFGPLLGLGSRRVSSHVNRLVQQGYLQTKVDRARGNTRYLIPTKRTRNLYMKPSMGMDKTDVRYGQNSPDPIDETVHKRNNRRNNRRENEVTQTSSDLTYPNVWVTGKPEGW